VSAAEATGAPADRSAITAWRRGEWLNSEEPSLEHIFAAIWAVPDLAGDRIEGTPAAGSAGEWPVAVQVEDERGATSKQRTMTFRIDKVPPAAIAQPRPAIIPLIIAVGVGLVSGFGLSRASANRKGREPVLGSRPKENPTPAGDGEDAFMVRCPNDLCGIKLRIRLRKAGKPIRCPKCNQKFIAPSGPG
jgi:hypothetical protein